MSGNTRLFTNIFNLGPPASSAKSNFQLPLQLEGKTPYEVFYKAKLNLHSLLEFGSKVWVHMTSGSKLDGRSDVGHWVGFDEDSSGHQIYSPNTCSVSIQ